jgi:hypothetical protein
MSLFVFFQHVHKRKTTDKFESIGTQPIFERRKPKKTKAKNICYTKKLGPFSPKPSQTTTEQERMKEQ